MELKSVGIFITIIFIHWIADFVMQTDWQAKNKSKQWDALLSHTLTYSCAWMMGSMILWNGGLTTSQYVLNSVLFAAITFVAHTITDYFTSRLNSRLWQEQKVHLFFVSVGFDQIMHYVQLLLTYYFISQ